MIGAAVGLEQTTCYCNYKSGRFSMLRSVVDVGKTSVWRPKREKTGARGRRAACSDCLWLSMFLEGMLEKPNEKKEKERERRGQLLKNAVCNLERTANCSYCNYKNG